MTTSKTNSTLTEIANSRLTAAGVIVAVPLAGAAVATDAWGWAAGAAVSACAGVAGAASKSLSKPPRPPGGTCDPPPGPEPSGPNIRTYNFLSETRISLLHAQLNRGKESDRLIEEMRKAQGRVQGSINVPRVSFIGEHIRETALRYQRKLEHTLATMTTDVLKELKQKKLVHGTDADDLEDVAERVLQPDSPDQFLKFTMAGPDFRRAASPTGWHRFLRLPQEREERSESHGLTITMHIGTRGMQEDFDALEDKENVAVVGVIRRLDTDNKIATVRVIAVY